MRWFQRKQREQDLERELHTHLELETQEQKERGLPTEGAHSAAQRAFGNTTLVKENVREVWGWLKLEQFLQDLRYGLRTLRQRPGFSLTAIASLALGIGANTAIFTVINAVLLRPLPFPEPDRLVQIWESKPSQSYFRNVVNPLNFLDWRERTRSFEGMAAVQTLTTNLTGLGDPLALAGMQVSPNYFSVLRVAPLLGRSFLPEEGLPGRDRVAILSFGLWKSHFGGDPKIMGRQVMINGEPNTIVGVMSCGFTLPKSQADLWTPLPITRSKEFEGGRYLTVIARLKRGVTLEQAQQDLSTVAQQSAVERPEADQGWSAEAIPMLTDATENVRLPLLVLLTAAGLVLLIACANVANLLLMRAANRQGEMALRAALGAGRRRLLQQLLSESLLLAILASIVGWAVAYGGVKALLSLIPPQNQLPRMDAVHMDGSVLLFALGLSVASTVLFGLIPSLQVSQTAPHQALAAGSTRSTAKGRLRQAFVVAEIALSLVLLAGASLLLRSFYRLVSVNPGFETQHILTMELFTSPAKYENNRKRANYFTQLLNKIRTIPGVREAGSVHFLPLQGQTSGSCFARLGEQLIPATAPDADFLVVSPGYFESMGTLLLQGRPFTEHDRPETHTVILVNRQFVKRFFPNRDPVGQKLNLCWTVTNPAEIVGVMADARQTELQTAPKPTIFVNNLQSPMYFAQLTVRTSGDPNRVARAVQAAIRHVDPDQAVTHIQTMEQVFSDSVAQPRLQLVLLLVFGGIAGMLAIVGIYGVVAYSVAQRTREIGIRMALGAQPVDMGRMVLREGLILAAAGISFGTGATLAFTRILRTLLFETDPADPATLGAVMGGILFFVFFAILIPARRAVRVNPTTALRYE